MCIGPPSPLFVIVISSEVYGVEKSLNHYYLSARQNVGLAGKNRSAVQTMFSYFILPE